MESVPSWMKESTTRERSEWTREREPSKRPSDSSSSRVRQIRETIKRLKAVYEDEGVEFGLDPTDLDALIVKFEMATKLRKNRIEDVFRNIRRARNVQLCFLVDCTGSMTSHIDGVRRSIDDILLKLTDNGPNVKFQDAAPEAQSMAVAFVAYRNIRDSNRIEVLPFTNQEDFKRFSHSLQADGGFGVEDVFGGLETALDLPWSMDCGTKVIFHIGDMPCHGREFYNGVLTDLYPEGDPQGRTPKVIFTKMRAQGIQYHFGKITRYTDIMIQKFSEAYGEPITEFDVKNVEMIRDSVISAVSQSISVSVSGSQRAGVARKEREFTLDKTEPDWAIIKEMEGTFVSYDFPKRIQDIEDDVPLERRKPKTAIVKVSKNPFGKGTERIAYYGKDLSTYVDKRGPKGSPASSHEIGKKDEELVLKEYLHMGKGMNSAKRYELSNQMQTVASYLAQIFVKDLKDRTGIDHTIKFIKIRTLSLHKESPIRFMSCERRFSADAKFVRFTNNADYHIMASKAIALGVSMEFVELVFAFSHWTYKASNRFLMVVDLEGVVETIKSTGKTGVLLTDPAIHCNDLTRYGPMNHGPGGMKGFLHRHVCNKFCKELGLEGFV